MPLGDPCADLAHDLLDVDVFAPALLLVRRRVPSIVATPVGPAPASMKVAPVLRILISH
jgi:hypothetical protein